MKDADTARMPEGESAYEQLVEAANKVINTIPDGKHVAVDLAAYNDLRDVLRRLGVLD